MLHKNWPEICKLVDLNPLLMMGLATLDLNKPELQAIAVSLPQFFVDHEVHGPVPFSVLKQEEMRVCDVPNVYYISAEVANSFGIPTLWFSAEEKRPDGPIPSELEERFESMKDVVEWKGKRFLVLRDPDIAGDLILAPADCIDINS